MVEASSKETPCFLKLDFALLESQSNLIISNYTIIILLQEKFLTNND
jgi:hypothetical protein